MITSEVTGICKGPVVPPPVAAVAPSSHQGFPRSPSLLLPSAVPVAHRVVDFKALSGVRELLTTRLYRFLVHKNEVVDVMDSGRIAGDGGDRAGVSRYHGGGIDGKGASGSPSRGKKGKQKARSRQQPAGRFQLVPLRLLEDRAVPVYSNRSGSGGDNGLCGSFRRNSTALYSGKRLSGHGKGIVPRDAIGHLLKCCWALVPDFEESSSGKGVTGEGKRVEAEAVARAILGVRVRRRGGRRRGVATISEGMVRTPEGEALLSVVEFFENGGRMEVRG